MNAYQYVDSRTLVTVDPSGKKGKVTVKPTQPHPDGGFTFGLDEEKVSGTNGVVHGLFAVSTLKRVLWAQH